MRLTSIQLNNFRQFYGETPKLEFGSGDKNVTAIHGLNGSGKSALLNAFTWILYKSFSASFGAPEEIVNKRAVREADDGENVLCWGELCFEHKGSKYRVRRETGAVKSGDQPWRYFERTHTVDVTDAEGTSRPASSSVDAINRVLAKELHSYFFFDGERIERIVKPTDGERKQFAKAIKLFIGTEIFERSISHINTAKKEFEKELGRRGDVDTKDILARINELESRAETHQGDLEEVEGYIESQDSNIAIIREQLRKSEAAKADQEKFEQLEAQRDENNENLKSLRTNLKKEISSHGYTVFLSDITGQFQALIDDLRQRGELPKGIKDQFVQDLLDKGICICERPLQDGDESVQQARKCVEEWLKKAGHSDVEDKAIRMGGSVAAVEKTINDFWHRVENNQTQTQRCSESIGQIEDELQSTRDRLQENPDEATQDLSNNLTKQEKERDGLVENRADIRSKLARINEELSGGDGAAGLRERLTREKSRDALSELAVERVRVAEDAANRISRSLEILQDQWRKELEKGVQKVWEKISVTPYKPTLDETFKLDLVDATVLPPLTVRRSTGESLVLSFAFIGALIDEARKFAARYGEDDDIAGGVAACDYPLVMDAPFGALDPQNAKHVSSKVSTLADQVIVMVQKTQWKGTVEQSLGPKVSRHYVLNYFSPKKTNPQTIELDGESYPLVSQSSIPHEYTEILEVKGG